MWLAMAPPRREGRLQAVSRPLLAPPGQGNGGWRVGDDGPLLLGEKRTAGEGLQKNTGTGSRSGERTVNASKPSDTRPPEQTRGKLAGRRGVQVMTLWRKNRLSTSPGPGKHFPNGLARLPFPASARLSGPQAPKASRALFRALASIFTGAPPLDVVSPLPLGPVLRLHRLNPHHRPGGLRAAVCLQ